MFVRQFFVGLKHVPTDDIIHVVFVVPEVSKWHEGFVPEGNQSSDDFFNDVVDAFMIYWMEIVYVTCNSLIEGINHQRSVDYELYKGGLTSPAHYLKSEKRSKCCDVQEYLVLFFQAFSVLMELGV